MSGSQTFSQADSLTRLAAALSLVVGLILAPGCAFTASNDQEGLKEMEQVTGTIFYRERMLLPPGAVAEITLQDVSRADAPARILARQDISDPPPPPIAFTLEYDPSEIDERMAYSVRAVIRHEGLLMFTSDTHYPVITRGSGNTADILLVRVTRAQAMPDASLENSYWKLVSLAGEPYRHEGAAREPHLKFLAGDKTVSGFGGCNAFTGNFEAEAGNLSMGPLAATQRACIQGMDVEDRFLEALGRVNRYEIQGDTLQLFDGDSALLGFEAIYF